MKRENKRELKSKKISGRLIFLNTLYIVFLILVILSFLFMVLGAKKRTVDYSFNDRELSKFNDDWLVSEGDDTGRLMSLPVDIGSNYNETIFITNTLPENTEDYNCLMIESKRQDVYVYVDKVLRKTYTDEGQKISNSMPYSYVMVPLHDFDGVKKSELSS